MEHEYSVLGGLNRAAIGRYLSIAASAIAAGLGTLAAWLIDFAKRIGIAEHVPALVLWPLTAGLIYMVLYWLFDSRIWKWGKLAHLLKVPDLADRPEDVAFGPRLMPEAVLMDLVDRLRKVLMSLTYDGPLFTDPGTVAAKLREQGITGAAIVARLAVMKS